jgi:hypothetical protein
MQTKRQKKKKRKKKILLLLEECKGHAMWQFSRILKVLKKRKFSSFPNVYRLTSHRNQGCFTDFVSTNRTTSYTSDVQADIFP